MPGRSQVYGKICQERGFENMENMDRTAAGMTTFRKLRHKLLDYKDEFDLYHQDFAVVDVLIRDYKNSDDAYGAEFCARLMEETARRILLGGMASENTSFVGRDMIMSLCLYSDHRELCRFEEEVRGSLGKIYEIDGVPCRPDYQVTAKVYSEMSYLERLMLMSHHRAHGRDNYSVEEMQLCMQEFRRFFQVVRLVNPSEMREIYFDAQGRVQSADHHCFEVWRRDGRCENCTSAKSCTQKGSFLKFEFLENEIYFVISQPVIVGGKSFVLELVRNVSSALEESMLENVFSNEEFMAMATASRRSQYRDKVTGLHNRQYFAEQIAGLSAIAAAVVKLDNEEEIRGIYGNETADRVLAVFAETVMAGTPTNAEVIRYSDNELLVMMDFITYAEFFDLLSVLQGNLRWSAESVHKGLELSTMISGIYGYGIASELTLGALRTMKTMEDTPESLVVLEGSN